MKADEVFIAERELPQRSVADHEVFYSFVNDEDAYAFNDWMLTTGTALFLAYLEARRSRDTE